jgi:hypothetical protein
MDGLVWQKKEEISRIMNKLGFIKSKISGKMNKI